MSPRDFQEGPAVPAETIEPVGRERDARPRHGIRPAETTSEAAGEDRKGAMEMPAEMAPFRDMPRGIWILFLSAWAALFGLFLLFFTVNLSAAFNVTIAALFAVMAFGLPSVLAGLPGHGPGVHGPIVQTHTGPLSVTAAGAQIALIPVAAVFGLIAFIVLAK